MRVMIQLREDAALELHSRLAEGRAAAKGKQKTEPLLDQITELGGKIEPVHPGQTHPLLLPYFMIEVPDQQTAEQVIKRLERFPAVEAAYLKPEDQLP